MGEIKSSIEIALERAAAMGEGDGEELARSEGAKRGEVMARRLLNGDMDLEEFAAGLAEIQGPGLAAARLAAGEMLLAGMPDNPQASLLGVKALADSAGAPQAADDVLAAAEAVRSASLDLEARLAEDLALQLREAGISGSAVRPNPQAHPNYEELAQSDLAEVSGRLADAGRALLESLEG